MNTNVETMSRNELLKLRKDVDKALRSVEKRKKKAALEAVQKAAAEHGFSLAELTGAKTAGKTKSLNPPKYRNPANPEQTWSGRGRKPAWINAAEAKGTDISSFAI